MKRFTYIFPILIFFIASRGFAADFTSKTDTNSALIGERINISLKFNIDKLPEELVFPSAMELFPSEIEIIDSSMIDTLHSEGQISLVKNYEVTSFDTGSYEIPAMSLIYRKEGLGELTPLSSEPLTITFTTVAVDTSAAFKAIKPPFDEPVTFGEVLPYILIALAILAAVLIVYFYLKRRKPKDKPIEKYDPKIPPHVFALEELRKLESEKLWQRDEIKRYHTRLSEIVRIYVERRFEINALEMTSFELLHLMERLIDESEYAKLKYILATADMAKFAKLKPLPDENTLAMKYSYEFVESTKFVDNNKTTETGMSSDE